MFLILEYFAFCRMCVLFDSWLVLPSRLELLWCSSCVGTRGQVSRRSFFLLIWAKLQVACWGLGDATQESRKEFKVRFRRVGSDWRGLQDFCFQLLSLFWCHLIYSAVFVLCFSICLPLGVGLCKGFFLAWKRGRGQVFNTHCVQVFYAYRFSYFLVLFVLWWHPGSWGGSFPRGPRSRFWLKGE